MYPSGIEFLRHTVHVVTQKCQVCFTSQPCLAVISSPIVGQGAIRDLPKLEGLCSPKKKKKRERERRLIQEFNLFASGDSVLFHFREMWVQWEMPTYYYVGV